MCLPPLVSLPKVASPPRGTLHVCMYPLVSSILVVVMVCAGLSTTVVVAVVTARRRPDETTAMAVMTTAVVVGMVAVTTAAVTEVRPTGEAGVADTAAGHLAERAGEGTAGREAALWTTGGEVVAEGAAQEALCDATDLTTGEQSATMNKQDDSHKHLKYLTVADAANSVTRGCSGQPRRSRAARHYMQLW